MYSNHKVFLWGIERQRRLKVTYLSDERREKLVRSCGPLYFSRGKTEADGLECYYLWDFEADESYNFIALSPGRIISMEPTEEPFSFDEISALGKKEIEEVKSRP